MSIKKKILLAVLALLLVGGVTVAALLIIPHGDSKAGKEDSPVSKEEKASADALTVAMPDYTISKGEKKEITITNPSETDEYDFEYDKEIIAITAVSRNGDECVYMLEGIKAGETKVDAYLYEERKLFGFFTVTVEDSGKKETKSNNSSSASVTTVNMAADATQKSMLVRTSLNLTFEKPASETYKCKVSDNQDKCITVDANNEGEYYWLMVKANKPTGSKRRIITVYKEEAGGNKVIYKYQINVKPYYTVKMDNISIGKGSAEKIMIKNPYELDEYELKYDSSIIKITQVLFSGDECYYNLKGLKVGKTTVKAYLKGAKKTVGSFTVTVGNYAAKIKDKYKNVTLYYNSHIKSEYLNGGNIDIGTIIANYNPSATYSVKSDKSGFIGYSNNHPNELVAKSVIMYTKKTGTATISVYEKVGKQAEKKIGAFNLKVEKTKDSEVYASNKERDNDGIFYEFFISPGDTVDLKAIVTKRYLNTSYSHFDDGECTFTFTAKNPDVISVDANGRCTCHKVGNNSVSYTIVFKDGSKVSGGGSFDTVDDENY